MEYAIAVKRRDPKTRKTIWVKKSKIYDGTKNGFWKAEGDMKRLRSKHPQEEYSIIKV